MSKSVEKSIIKIHELIRFEEMHDTKRNETADKLILLDGHTKLKDYQKTKQKWKQIIKLISNTTNLERSGFVSYEQMTYDQNWLNQSLVAWFRFVS